MIETAPTYKHIRLIPFKDLLLWDVKAFTRNTLKVEEGYLALNEVLEEIKIPISHEQIKKDHLQIISKINFSGELFLRDFEEINSYKGKLFLVPSQTLIFSKINARHGCIHFNNSQPFAVSSEYPVFKIDTTKADGEYLHLALRTKKVKEHLSSKITGVSKPRLKSEEFISLPIPLPPLKKQKILVSNYHKQIQLAEQQQNELTELETEITDYLNVSFGIKRNINFKKEKFNIIRYKNIDKWGLDFANSFSNWELSPKYPELKISQLCKVSSGGTPNTSNRNYYDGNIPWVRTTEVINDLIMDTEIKITEQGLENSSAKIYPAGSLIIAMYGQGITRGRTAKLGIDAATNQACAVLFNINEEIILTDFLWIYLINEYERLRELASGNNQPNLNAGMIQDYKIQIPPKKIQREIIQQYNSNRKKIKALEAKSEENLSMALQEFEQSIFNNK
jgi:restriction endonuclease S subunit